MLGGRSALLQLSPLLLLLLLLLFVVTLQGAPAAPSAWSQQEWNLKNSRLQKASGIAVRNLGQQKPTGPVPAASAKLEDILQEVDSMVLDMEHVLYDSPVFHNTPDNKKMQGVMTEMNYIAHQFESSVSHDEPQEIAYGDSHSKTQSTDEDIQKVMAQMKDIMYEIEENINNKNNFQDELIEVPTVGSNTGDSMEGTGQVIATNKRKPSLGERFRNWVARVKACVNKTIGEPGSQKREKTKNILRGVVDVVVRVAKVIAEQQEMLGVEGQVRSVGLKGVVMGIEAGANAWSQSNAQSNV